MIGSKNGKEKKLVKIFIKEKRNRELGNWIVKRNKEGCERRILKDDIVWEILKRIKILRRNGIRVRKVEKKEIGRKEREIMRKMG